MPGSSSPSWLRWIVVGVPCYAGWLVVNIALVLFFPFYIAVELIGGARGRRLLRRFCIVFLRGFFLHYLPLLGVYRIEPSEDLKRMKDIGSCLLVANHTSWLDALLLFALIPEVRILVSARYANVPLVRYPMRWLECIFVDRRSRESIMSSLQALREALQTGVPVAVFPEGTRSEVGRLGPFREVFFRVAVDANAAIQPVLLYLERPFLGPGAENFLTAKKTALRIRLLDRITPDTRERGEDLAFRTRSAMKKALGGLIDSAKQRKETNG